jgi:hypothetical protein
MFRTTSRAELSPGDTKYPAKTRLITGGGNNRAVDQAVCSSDLLCGERVDRVDPPQRQARCPKSWPDPPSVLRCRSHHAPIPAPIATPTGMPMAVCPGQEPIASPVASPIAIPAPIRLAFSGLFSLLPFLIESSAEMHVWQRLTTDWS